MPLLPLIFCPFPFFHSLLQFPSFRFLNFPAYFSLFLFYSFPTFLFLFIPFSPPLPRHPSLVDLSFPFPIYPLFSLSVTLPSALSPSPAFSLSLPPSVSAVQSFQNGAFNVIIRCENGATMAAGGLQWHISALVRSEAWTLGRQIRPAWTDISPRLPCGFPSDKTPLIFLSF